MLTATTGHRRSRSSTGHEIQFGYGTGGDGFCYPHQSFSCIDHLTEAEKLAVREAS